MTQPSSLDMPSGSIQMDSLPLSGTGVQQGSGLPDDRSRSWPASSSRRRARRCRTAPTVLTSGCIHASDEKAADLKYVGTTSDTPELTQLGDDPGNLLGDGEEYFAITTQGPWHTAASQNEYDIYIDTNGDGTPDLVTFNTRLDGTDILIDETIDLNTQEVVDEEPLNDRFADTDTALFDSDTLVMPVWLQPMADEGVSVGNSRITYGIVTFGQFSSDPVDTVGLDDSLNLDGSLSTDVLNPGVAVYGDPDTSGGNGLILYQDEPNTSLTVRRDAASYAADHGMGAMIVHFHNTVGNKAQIVDLDHHSLTVQKSGAGSGTVTSSPSGISCGSTCSASYASGASVTLTATPASGSSWGLVGRRLLGHRHLSGDAQRVRDGDGDVRPEGDADGEHVRQRIRLGHQLAGRDRLRLDLFGVVRERHIRDAHCLGRLRLEVRRLVGRRLFGNGHVPGDADRRDFGHGQLHQEQEEGHNEAEGDEPEGEGEERHGHGQVPRH